MIAIHNSSEGFHPRWKHYCQQNGIPYKLVDCYSNDLIQHLNDCSGLMWHHSQNNPKAIVAAKPILFALEHAGIKVFPDFRTNWHFDDKLGQKYLLEALGVPFVDTWVFYDKSDALQWAKETTFPKVFKLRTGAGSANVRLIKSRRQACSIIHKAFGKGFSSYDGWRNFKEDLRKWKLSKVSFFDMAKGFARLFYPPKFAQIAGNEKGYVYFQDFIPDNTFDIRVIIIGNKAFAIKRMVRKNDFRASGSGHILYEKHHFKDDWIELAFGINNKVKAQVLALDYVFDNNNPKVVEINYGFAPEGYDLCPGYWDNTLQWHEGHFDPYGWMVELMINEKA